MNIIVCIKGVPLTEEADLIINDQRKDISTENLPRVTNEWDNFALEEAIKWRDQKGGKVTAINVGNIENDEILKRALAMGVDDAVRIDPGNLFPDSFVVSALLAEGVKTIAYDAIFTGVQADDHNCGTVGAMLAERLGIAFTGVVTGLEVDGPTIKSISELEDCTNEITTCPMPALITIQTGINDPRYVPYRAVKKAAKCDIPVMHINDFETLKMPLEPQVFTEELFMPPEGDGATMFEGEPRTVADEILRVIHENGVRL